MLMIFRRTLPFFLLQRIEYGCEGKAYASRTQNEARIDKADIMNMSCLTRRLLDGIDYEAVKRKRTENFKLAELMLKKYNQMELTQFYDDTCVPMVYPLMLEKENLLIIYFRTSIFKADGGSICFRLCRAMR